MRNNSVAVETVTVNSRGLVTYYHWLFSLPERVLDEIACPTCKEFAAHVGMTVVQVLVKTPVRFLPPKLTEDTLRFCWQMKALLKKAAAGNL